MKLEKPITLHVYAKREEKGMNVRVFISDSDYERTLAGGYLISIIPNKEFYVPTSSSLYEHHYEVSSVDYPKDMNVDVKETPFVYNAPSTKTMKKKK